MTKKRIGIIIVSVLLILSVIGTLKHIKRSPVSLKNGTSSLSLPSAIKLNVYKINDNHWGYDILIDNKTVIFQHHIPSVKGKQPFTTQLDAMKCGELVLEKIKRNQLPAVSVHEIDSLKISYQP